MENPVNPNSELSDDQIIERINKGEKKLFSVLFERYVSRIFRYTCSLVNSREEAREITQEIFLKVFQGLPGYRPQGHFLAWILTITRRYIIDQRRKGTAPIVDLDEVREFLAAPDGANPQELILTSESLEILNGLQPQEREILLLRFVEGFSYKEISEMTDFTEGSLRNIICRAIGKLKLLVKENVV